jgi:hypothetical protein
MGGDYNTVVTYANIFNCRIDIFLLKYLGVPIWASILHVIDWIKLNGKLAKN